LNRLTKTPSSAERHVSAAGMLTLPSIRVQCLTDYRKRKMRCDGTRPSCQQCTRAKKGDGCEYDDGKGKTRTQILRETIVKLEQRVKELEDPEYISPSVTLFDPHFHSRSNSSSSSFGSPESSYLSTSHSPFPSGESSMFTTLRILSPAILDSSPASPPGSWTQLQASSSLCFLHPDVNLHKGHAITCVFHP